MATKDLPPLDSVADDRARALWILAAADQDGESMMTPTEISTTLRDVHKIDVPRQRVLALLEKERGTVARRRKGGARAFQIMRAGLDVVSAASTATVTYRRPGSLTSALPRRGRRRLAFPRGRSEVPPSFESG